MEVRVGAPVSQGPPTSMAVDYWRASRPVRILMASSGTAAVWPRGLQTHRSAMNTCSLPGRSGASRTSFFDHPHAPSEASISSRSRKRRVESEVRTAPSDSKRRPDSQSDSHASWSTVGSRAPPCANTAGLAHEGIRERGCGRDGADLAKRRSRASRRRRALGCATLGQCTGCDATCGGTATVPHRRWGRWSTSCRSWTRTSAGRSSDDPLSGSDVGSIPAQRRGCHRAGVVTSARHPRLRTASRLPRSGRSETLK